MQLESPSVVNAAAARAHARHTHGSTWHCQSRCLADHCRPVSPSMRSLGCGHQGPASATSHPSPWASSYQVLASRMPAQLCHSLGRQLVCFSKTAETCSEVQESHPWACVPHQSVGARHVPGYGLRGFSSSLGTRDVTERCGAGLLCYYGDKRWGDGRNKMQKNPQQLCSKACSGDHWGAINCPPSLPLAQLRGHPPLATPGSSISFPNL